MSDLELRPLRLTDCEAAGAIVGDNPLWRDHYHYTSDKAARDLLYAASHGDYVLGAFDRQTLAGFVWIVPKAGFGRSPYLRLIAVAPSAQSRGVGAELLDHAEAHFAKDARHLFLLVSDFNARAQEFYQGRGFQKLGAIPDFVLPGIGEQIWVKLLRSQSARR